MQARKIASYSGYIEEYITFDENRLCIIHDLSVKKFFFMFLSVIFQAFYITVTL